MAREQRNDVDYFPHQCTHGRKMDIMEAEYGNDGYAVWFKLLEQLGKANFHFIEISDEMNFRWLTRTVFKVDPEKLMCILNDLAKLGAIDKNLFENHNILYSEKFVRSVEDAYKKRKSNLLTKEEILIKVKTQRGEETPQSAPETFQSAPETNLKGTKPSESIPKEKKRIEKEKKEESRSRAIDFLKLKFPQRFESEFLMKYKSKIQNYKKFVEDFNDTVDQEELDFTDRILFGRLGKYSRNWIENQIKYSKIPVANSYESGKLESF